MTEFNRPALPLVVRDPEPVGREGFTVALDDGQPAIVVTITDENGAATDFALRAGEARLVGASLRRAARELERLHTGKGITHDR